MQLGKKLNAYYGAIHGSYWMYFGVLGAFSSVYLLSKGYSNSEIGLILAVANTLAILVQPFLAQLADQGKKRTIFSIIGVITTVNLALSTAMIFQGERSILLTILFTLCFALMMTNQPFINAVNRRLEETGVRIAFGACRGVGSLAYAVICYFLGIIVEKSSPNVLPGIGDAVLILILLVVFTTYRAYQSATAANSKGTEPAFIAGSKGTEPASGAAENIEEDDTISLKDFVTGHKLFFAMSIGIMGLYFANAVPNTYLAQIVSGVGGDSTDVGRILSLLAVTEIPTLILFDRLYKRFSTKSMLIVASIAYVVWMFLFQISRSVGMMLGAQLVHFLAFPLFLPAMVRFIDDNMRPGEAVKGQTLFTVMITIGNMLASLIGGVILDLSGTKALMMTGTAAAIVGAAIIIAMIGRVESSK